MIDNLKDAIAHEREEAKTLKKRAMEFRENKHPIFSFAANDVMADNYLERARYNEQLASWLEELAERREADKWISVDEALPEKAGWYLVDRKERIFSIQYFFFGLADHKPYWSGECKVYYWRPLPKAPEGKNNADE